MYSCLIRGQVEFERCLPESVSCIRATTRRMALRDALETSRNVRQMAEDYASEFDTILAELERGRSHIIMELVMQTNVRSQPPYALHAAGHHDEEKARAAVLLCLNSKNRHPQILELQSSLWLMRLPSLLAAA